MHDALSRRRFLQSLASIGLVARAGLPVLTSCSSSSAGTPALDDLAARLPGRVVRPGSAGFDDFTTPWNMRWIGKRPIASAVVRAESAADVASALRWAGETGTPIAARSGGHSYSGYSSTRGVIVDVSSMTAVTFDAASGQAVVGGGARNTHVYEALRAADRTVTHGRCYRVGVAGLVLGGGVGFNMRRLGLTCDQLVSTDVVLANGQVVRASAAEEPDLFWAARGAGGGNFGIHTSFTFQTAPAVDLAVFDRTYRTRVDELLAKLFEIALDPPRALGLKFNVRATPDGAGGVAVVLNILGQWAGPMADLQAWLASLDAIATADASVGFLGTVKYWDGQKVLSDDGLSEFMYERSHYVVDKLGADAVGAIMGRLRAWPSTSLQASWKGFLTGGAIRDVAPDATAFVHRRDWLLSTTEVNWAASDDPARVLDSLLWLDAFHEDMARFTIRESYQNFIDDSQADWQTSYYGANLPRLIALKRRLDPTNKFNYPQSIPLG
jgi:FAD/FMN-containing dehydrogenase